MHVTIIGGGVIGLSTAYYLRKEGIAVTVIDKGDITDGCSFGNMGYMSPSHFIPLASPGIIAKGLKWMLSSSSPFFIKPRMSMDLLKWGIQFWNSSKAINVERNAPHLNNLLQLSRNLMNDMRTDLGNDFEMQEKGCFMLCNTQKALEHEFELADEAEKFGLRTQKLNSGEVQALEPHIELDVKGAVLFEDDCHFDPGKLMRSLRSWLESNGTDFRLNTTVSAIEKRGDKVTNLITDKGNIPVEELIIAAGSWIPQLTGMIGKPLNMQPGKGYSYTYGHVENNIRYPAILVEARCAITPWTHRLRIGGTMELSGINHKIIGKRMTGIYNSVKKYYPGLDIQPPPVEKIWCGLRPVTPDGLPYIGRLMSNVTIAGGHAMLGVSMGTGTGQLVTSMLTQNSPEIDMHAFRADRFS